MKLNRRLGISDEMIELIQSITEKKKMDPVDQKALKKDFDDREDKDIDNDGDVDKSDKYLHNRRKAVSKAMSKGKGSKDQVDVTPALDDTTSVNEEGIPTGIKIHHQNPQGKKGHMIVFSARDAQRAHKDLKKDGHTVTGHQLMYGAKAGPMHKVNEEAELGEAKADRLQMIKKAAEKIKARDKAAEKDAKSAMRSPGAQRGMAPVKQEAVGVAPDAVDKHNCATHVYHEQWGQGQTIYSMHADPDEYGLIEWYDVVFDHGVEKAVPTNEMKVTREMSHGNHKKKK